MPRIVHLVDECKIRMREIVRGFGLRVREGIGGSERRPVDHGGLGIGTLDMQEVRVMHGEPLRD